MTAWADPTFARRHWADAQRLDDATLLELLEVATAQCEAFAPGFTTPAPVPVAPPTLSSLAPLRLALSSATRSAAQQLLGDSTGNDPTDWPTPTMQAIAESNPAWTFQTILWQDSTQDYGAATVLQTGTAGPRYLDGTTGTTTRRLDPSVSPHLSGAIDVRIKMSLPDWTPAALTAVVGKSAGDPNRGWYCGINSSGSGSRPFFTWSTGGLGADLQTMTVIGTPTVADGATLWMRWVFNPNDGVGNRTLSAYQSTDGATWTQIGATVTTAGTTTLFNNSAVGYEVGGSSSGLVPGIKVYEVQIRNGIGGPNVVPALPELWPPYNTSAAQVVGAPVMTLVNGSHPGANIAYLNAAGRLAKMTPDYGQIATFISTSHNEGLAVGDAWVTLLDGFRAAVEQQVPGAPVTLLTQNPESSGTSWYREHARRRLDTIGYAAQKGVGLIDTYQAFLDAGWPGALMLDDVHPNAAGSLVWRDAVLAQIIAQPVTVVPTVEVPTRYQLAVVYQAREVYAAATRDGDVIGVGDYAIRSRPLTGAVKQLLRPASYSLFVGTDS